jgi:RHS repeat-associated protein
MESLLGVTAPNSSRNEVKFMYDHLGRRVYKCVGTWNGGTYANHMTNKFVSEGWLVLAELAGTNQLSRSYSWGLDMYQTVGGAAGVGGLTIVYDHVSPAAHFPSYDAIGSVMVLTKNDGSKSASYDYSPFGQILRAQGPLARSSPFRFCTKLLDDETGLSYFGYRYYSAETGRWLGIDPLGERFSRNLTLYCANSPIVYFDPNGLFTIAAGFSAEVGAGLMFQDSFQLTLTINGWNPLDWQGGMTASVMPFTGVTTSITGSAGLLFSYSGATDVRQWNGTSLTVGASAGEFAVLGFDVGNLGGGGPAKYDVFIGEGVIFGLGAMPWEAHTGATFTTGSSISPRQVINVVWDAMVEFWSGTE